LTALVLDDLVALAGIAYAGTSLVTALHFEGRWRWTLSTPGEPQSRSSRPGDAEAMRSLDPSMALD